MAVVLKYLRLLGSLGRYTLARELAFRGNFLVKVSVEVLWLGILLAFYRTVFTRTDVIAGWSEPQYLFFVGHVPTEAGTWLAYAASLVLAFLVGFFFETSVGMVGFWFLEVTSLLYIVMTLNFFISGHMLPLDLLPWPWAGLLKMLPFQYMAYFPAVVFLGKVRGRELALGLLAELGWALAFFALSRWLYRRGLRRYGAFGG